MSNNKELANKLYSTTGEDEHNLNDPNVAHVLVHHNEVLSSHELPGLHVEVEELQEGIRMNFVVDPGAVIEKPVHLCFGMMPEEGVQAVTMNVDIGANAKVSVRSHCTFPYAVEVIHKMDAVINVGEGAEYNYFERHVHSPEGGVTVLPKANVTLEKGARFLTEFELLKGRVGHMEIEYETTCHAESVMEMKARVNGTGDDYLKVSEIGHLVGEHSRGVLASVIALRDNAKAEIFNKLTATAPYARGHVDCKEIVQDNGIATAIPIVEVSNPLAHVTHEAAIGSVDSKQLDTLMARGLDEEAAVELIIQGMLQK